MTAPLGPAAIPPPKKIINSNYNAKFLCNSVRGVIGNIENISFVVNSIEGEEEEPLYECDSENLDLCESQQDCASAFGYWYNNICNKNPEPKTSAGATSSGGSTRQGTASSASEKTSDWFLYLQIGIGLIIVLAIASFIWFKFGKKPNSGLMQIPRPVNNPNTNPNTSPAPVFRGSP